MAPTSDHLQQQNTLPPTSSGIKSRLKASYDIIAPTYNRWTEQNTAQRLDYLNKLIALMPQVSAAPTDTTTITSNDDVDSENNTTTTSTEIVRVLELGCGCGVPVTRGLVTHYPNIHVIANDLSSTQIQLAQEALSSSSIPPSVAARVDFVQGDMATVLPHVIQPGSLDAVFGLYSIFHLPRDEQPGMLRKIAGWLKPGGYFLGNFAEEDAEAVVFDNWLHEDGWMFFSGWGAAATLRLVRDAGLEVVLDEVKEDVVRSRFLWVLARKP